MGNYVIKGSGSYAPITVSDFGNEQPLFNSIVLNEIPVDPGTSISDPNYLWRGHGGSISCYTFGTQFNYEIIPMNGTQAGTGGTDSSAPDLSLNLYLGSYSYMNGDTKMVRVFYYIAYSPDDVYTALERGLGVMNTLYQNTFATAEDSLFEYEAAWDESPDATGGDDPMREGPQGGEFADREEFGKTTDVDLPGVPDEVTLSGFMTIYNMDGAGVNRLGNAIFTSNTWTNLRNKFNGVGDPISYIISAVEIPVRADREGSKNFNLGGIDIEDSDGNKVQIPYTTFRYKKLEFGSVTLKEVWGTEKDYSQTSVSIYLPYIGVKDLDAEMVMNSTITLRGCIDVTNGDLFYALLISKKDRPGVYISSSGIAYRFQGNAGRQIPVGRADNTGQLAAMFGGMASMGVGLVSGNPMAAIGGAAAMIGGAAMGPKVSMSSGAGGSIGRADVQYPYLIITQKVPVYPNNWRQHIGAPRNQTFTLNQLHGYTEFSEYHADQIEGANDAERAAIEQTMKAGVFLP